MKRILVMVLAAVLCFSFSSFAADAVYEHDKTSETVGWSIYGADDDVDTAYQLITELNTTYAQLAAEDTIEVLSSSVSDVLQSVTIEGINNKGNRIKEDIALNTTTGTTEATSSNTFRYIDQAFLNSGTSAGTITIRRATGDTFITSIPAGSMESTQVQHFNGEKNSYITGWGATVSSTIASIIFDLRWYPDDARCLAPTTGYRLIDQITLPNSSIANEPHPFAQPVKCPAGGWITIHAIGGANDADAAILIQGYDSNP